LGRLPSPPKQSNLTKVCKEHYQSKLSFVSQYKVASSVDLLYVVENYKVYGYVSNSQIKFIVVHFSCVFSKPVQLEYFANG